MVFASPIIRSTIPSFNVASIVRRNQATAINVTALASIPIDVIVFGREYNPNKSRVGAASPAMLSVTLTNLLLLAVSWAVDDGWEYSNSPY